ncbi:uncharacterized protein PG986_002386 [Apiospora aurea]|uniref:Amidoligase enzyme n=1 Tax=Apiospora aurea TaxID=335848 RepID=A0ABR1QZQ0_9PEZI
MSSSQANTAASDAQPTFGVEWEFFLCYYHPSTEEEHDEYADAISTAYPGTIIIPFSIKGRTPASFHVRQETIATLRQSGIDINGINDKGAIVTPPEGDGPQSSHRFYLNTAHGKYLRWSMMTDGSLHPTTLLAGRDASPNRQLLSWVGLELISPAMRDEAASYSELERVVDFIKARYRARVNLACGLHVHTALGRQPVSLDALKQCAALLFAADSLVAEIHPRHRQENTFARPIRTQSNAAVGWTAIDAEKSYNEAPSNQYGWFCDRDPQPEVRLRDAVREIMACQSEGAIAWITATRYTSGNYYFVKFALPNNDNPTLEFRQHEGTLDAQRMSAWARFCAGIFRYAVQDLTPAKLDEVVAFCEEAESDKSGKLYLYELLESLGMAEQARNLGLQPGMRTDPDDLVDMDKLTLND